MADPTDTPRALLAIAAETFREEILADLPKDKRYAGAMTANALAIAERMLAAGDPMQALCEALGNAYGGNAEDLARAIRNRKITDASHPDLRTLLHQALTEELQQTNPRFLANREG